MTRTSSSDGNGASVASSAGAPGPGTPTEPTIELRSPVIGAAEFASPPPHVRAGRLFRLAFGKIVGAAIVLLGAATAAFFAQTLLPGDRATTIYNIRAGQAIERTPEELAQINDEYGLQNPVLQQYWDYVRGLAAGDLGNSYQQYRPVIEVIGEQILPTIVLTLTAILFAWVLMIVWLPLTAGRGSRVRSIGSVAETTAAGLPPYWLGIVLLLVFSLTLGWFPVISGSSFAGLVLPALTLAIPLAGFLGQATRAEFERSLEQPFVTTARMRGMSDLGVRFTHVLRHSVLPGITLSGWALGATISGAVVVEAVFSRVGIGKVLVAAVNQQDLPIVLGIVMLIAAVYVVANLLVDLAHLLIDPRLKAS